MASSAITDDQANLAELPGGQASGPNDHAVTVIVVPDIDSPHQAKSWSDGSACWLSTRLPSLLTRPYVLEFSYGLPNGDDFSWERLVHCGDILLERLLARASDLEFLRRPLIFICHGLGGVVAKRAIGVLYDQYWELSFERLIGILSGIVFLGSPHPLSERPQDLDKLNLLLRSSTKLSKKVIERNIQLLPAIASVSQRFNDAGTKVPILSAFETKSTRVGRNLFSPKREILVDESLAKTRAIRETMVRVDCPHTEICNLLPTSLLSNALETFLREAEKFVTPPSVTSVQQGPRSFAGWTGTASEKPEVDHVVSQASNLATFKSSGMSSFEIVDLKEAISMKESSPEKGTLLKLPTYLFKPHIPNPDFRGREGVIKSLKEALQPSIRTQNGASSTGLKTFALCGVGGLGKTQIAVEYAYSSRDDFEAIYFLQASDTGKLAQGFADIAVELGLETLATAGDQVVTKDLVLGWLSAPTRQLQDGAKSTEDSNKPEPTWLIVFDNADDLTVLHDFWPVTGNGSILVTSRDPLAKTRTHVSVTKGLDLEPLSTAEAGTLLRQLTGYTKPKDVEISEEIAIRLSGLPLAIYQIAGTISRRIISFEEFLELYDQESLRLDFYQSEIGANPKTLWTVWAFDDLSPSALSLLNLIAFLDPDQISEELLSQMGKAANEGHPVPENYPSQVKAFVDARTELSKSSLVKRNIDRKELIIHRIIQDTTRLRMNADSLKSTFESATGLLHSSWPFGEFNHSTARWRICEPLVPHIGYIHVLFQSSNVLQSVDTAWPKLAFLFMDLGWYHIERGNLSESLPILKAAERICDLAPRECAITAGDVHGCLYYIAIVTNDTQSALSHCKAKVAIFEELDKNGWRLAQAHSELAESLNAAGMYGDAIREADIAIAKYGACEEPEYADWAQMNKGRALCSLDRLDEASKVLEDYLAYRERTFGVMDTESHKTGQGLLYLGTVRGCQGRPAESLDLYLKALAQYHSTVGPKHFRVADVYQKIGATYVVLGLSDEASFMFRKALQIYGEKPEYMAHSARTLFGLAKVQFDMKLTKEAEDTSRKANERLAALGRKHGTVITEEELDAFIPNWSK